jgi:cytidine deaminase
MTSPAPPIQTRVPSEPGADGPGADLLEAAPAARVRAYVPYSHLAMGAAVCLADGSMLRGAAVQNVSLGPAMGAERCGCIQHRARRRRQPVMGSRC